RTTWSTFSILPHRMPFALLVIRRGWSSIHESHEAPFSRSPTASARQYAAPALAVGERLNGLLVPHIRHTRQSLLRGMRDLRVVRAVGSAVVGGRSKQERTKTLRREQSREETHLAGRAARMRDTDSGTLGVAVGGVLEEG